MANYHDIETSYVHRYSADVLHALQQKTSRLRNFVTNKPDCSGVAEFIDKIGTAEALDKVARFADSPVQAIAHKRRRVSAQPKNAGYFVEGFDTRRMNYDVFQPYAEATSMAMARKMDATIVDAAFGSAYDFDQTNQAYREELIVSEDRHFSDEKWREMSLNFLRNIKFYSDYGKANFKPLVKKNLESYSNKQLQLK